MSFLPHGIAGRGVTACLILTLAAGLSACQLRQGFERVGRSIDQALGTDGPSSRNARLPATASARQHSPTSLLQFREKTPGERKAPPAAELVKRSEPTTGDTLYRDGLVAQRAGDHARAAALFRKAAELEHGAAAYELADAYNFGRGVERDTDAAADWVQRAAEYGNPQAQYVVGAAHYYGRGLPRDPTRAVRNLLPAARLGDPRAQYLLGEAYADGTGIRRDLPWSARWYGKAAAQGHGPAQFAYGVAWAAGLGLPRNSEKAYYWLTVAADNGVVDAADVRDTIGQQLSAAVQERSRNDAGRFTPQADGSLVDPPTVLYVQTALNELGYDPGEPDGQVGATTRQAIESFQRINGYPDTGEITSALLQQILDRRRGVATVAAD